MAVTRFTQFRDANFNIPLLSVPYKELATQLAQIQSEYDTTKSLLTRAPRYIQSSPNDVGAFDLYKQGLENTYNQLNDAFKTGDMSMARNMMRRVSEDIVGQWQPGGLAYQLEARKATYDNELAELKKYHEKDPTSTFQNYDLSLFSEQFRETDFDKFFNNGSLPGVAPATRTPYRDLSKLTFERIKELSPDLDKNTVLVDAAKLSAQDRQRYGILGASSGRFFVTRSGKAVSEQRIRSAAEEFLQGADNQEAIKVLASQIEVTDESKQSLVDSYNNAIERLTAQLSSPDIDDTKREYTRGMINGLQSKATLYSNMSNEQLAQSIAREKVISEMLPFAYSETSSTLEADKTWASLEAAKVRASATRSLVQAFKTQPVAPSTTITTATGQSLANPSYSPKPLVERVNQTDSDNLRTTLDELVAMGYNNYFNQIPPAQGVSDLFNITNATGNILRTQGDLFTKKQVLVEFIQEQYSGSVHDPVGLAELLINNYDATRKVLTDYSRLGNVVQDVRSRMAEQSGFSQRVDQAVSALNESIGVGQPEYTRQEVIDYFVNGIEPPRRTYIPQITPKAGPVVFQSKPQDVPFKAIVNGKFSNFLSEPTALDNVAKTVTGVSITTIPKGSSLDVVMKGDLAALRMPTGHQDFSDAIGGDLSGGTFTSQDGRVHEAGDLNWPKVTDMMPSVSALGAPSYTVGVPIKGSEEVVFVELTKKNPNASARQAADMIDVAVVGLLPQNPSGANVASAKDIVYKLSQGDFIPNRASVYPSDMIYFTPEGLSAPQTLSGSLNVSETIEGPGGIASVVEIRRGGSTSYVAVLDTPDGKLILSDPILEEASDGQSFRYTISPSNVPAILPSKIEAKKIAALWVKPNLNNIQATLSTISKGYSELPSTQREAQNIILNSELFD